MTYRLAAIGLAPVLLAQAAYTRRVTPRLPEPPGPRQGSAGAGRPLRLLIAGDSAAAGVGAATQAAALSGRLVSGLAHHFCVSWQLMARTGVAIADLVQQLDAAPRQAFDVAVLSVGVNDVTGGTSARRWLQLQSQLVELLTMEFEVRHLLLACIPPMQYFPALPHPLGWYLGKRSAHLNQLSLDGVQRNPRCEFVDPGYVPEGRFIASDGFHPAPDAYAWWAQHLSWRIVNRWC
jgi:lysophospholipase L1-like esterase